MATYATVTDLEDYLDRDTTDDDARVLDQAERDVDQILRLKGARVDATGLKVDPASLGAHEAAALARGVCAQAEYRLAKGDEFFIHAQHSRVTGPDFATTGKLPYIGPKVWRELSATGLTSGRLTSVTLASPYSPCPEGWDE